MAAPKLTPNLKAIAVDIDHLLGAAAEHKHAQAFIETVETPDLVDLWGIAFDLDLRTLRDFAGAELDRRSA
jgi:hypothetical protein